MSSAKKALINLLTRQPYLQTGGPTVKQSAAAGGNLGGVIVLPNVKAGNTLIVAAGSQATGGASSLTDNFGNVWTRFIHNGVAGTFSVWGLIAPQSGNYTITTTTSGSRTVTIGIEMVGVNGTIEAHTELNQATVNGTDFSVNVTTAKFSIMLGIEFAYAGNIGATNPPIVTAKATFTQLASAFEDASNPTFDANTGTAEWKLVNPGTYAVGFTNTPAPNMTVMLTGIAIS